MQWYNVWQQLSHREAAPPDPDYKLRWPDWALKDMLGETCLNPTCRIFKCTALRQSEMGLIKLLHIAVPPMASVVVPSRNSWNPQTTIPAISAPLLVTLRREHVISEDGDDGEYDNVSWIAAMPNTRREPHWITREYPEGGPAEAEMLEMWPKLIEYWASQPDSPPAGESAPAPSPSQSQAQLIHDEGPEPDGLAIPHGDDDRAGARTGRIPLAADGAREYWGSPGLSRDVPVNLQSPGTVSAAEERIAAEEQRTGRRLSVTERARVYFRVYEESRRTRRQR